MIILTPDFQNLLKFTTKYLSNIYIAMKGFKFFIVRSWKKKKNRKEIVTFRISKNFRHSYFQNLLKFRYTQNLSNIYIYISP